MAPQDPPDRHVRLFQEEYRVLRHAFECARDVDERPDGYVRLHQRNNASKLSLWPKKAKSDVLFRFILVLIQVAERHVHDLHPNEQRAVGI